HGQIRSRRIVGFNPRQATLHANEFRPCRIAMIVEPVGVDEPGRIVVGMLDDVRQKRLMIHRQTPAAKEGCSIPLRRYYTDVPYPGRTRSDSCRSASRAAAAIWRRCLAATVSLSAAASRATWLSTLSRR